MSTGDESRTDTRSSSCDLDFKDDGRLHGTNLFSLGKAHPSRWMHSEAQ